MDLNEIAAEIGVTPEILTHGMSATDGLLIGKVIMMMKAHDRPRELDMLKELVPPTIS